MLFSDEKKWVIEVVSMAETEVLEVLKIFSFP